MIIDIYKYMCSTGVMFVMKVLDAFRFPSVDEDENQRAKRSGSRKKKLFLKRLSDNRSGRVFFEKIGKQKSAVFEMKTRPGKQKHKTVYH